MGRLALAMCWVAMGHLEGKKEQIEFQIHHLANVLQWWVIQVEVGGLSLDVGDILGRARRRALPAPPGG